MRSIAHDPLRVLLIQSDDARTDLANEFRMHGYLITELDTAGDLTGQYDPKYYHCVITDCVPGNFSKVIRAIEKLPNPCQCLVHHWYEWVLDEGEMVVLEEEAMKRTWLTFKKRGVGRVNYLWNFLKGVDEAR